MQSKHWKVTEVFGIHPPKWKVTPVEYGGRTPYKTNVQFDTLMDAQREVNYRNEKESFLDTHFSEKKVGWIGLTNRSNGERDAKFR
jgi:hypothetical protein